MPFLLLFSPQQFYLLFVVLLGFIAWAITRTIEALIDHYLVPVIEKSESDLDDQLLPILRKALKVTVWIMAIIIGFNNAGYDVGAIVAGLGIGGLAFALAAQDSVKIFLVVLRFLLINLLLFEIELRFQDLMVRLKKLELEVQE